MSRSDPALRAGAILTIDLDAIAANHRSLAARLTSGRAAGVVKADAYGLGMARVAPALAAAGCSMFFVAHLDEGIALKALLPDADVAILNGLMPGCAADYAAYRVMPVLNDLGALEAWRSFAAERREAPPAILHVDTGMTRLGLARSEVDRLVQEPQRLAGVRLACVMSHLACADEAGHPLNERQLADFRAALARLPAKAPASLANSSGIFLGPAYHFDLARPGIAVYGGNPLSGRPNPMRQAVRLQARILQVRDVDRSMTVGYGATHRVSPPAKLATIAVGYADGYLRSLSNRGGALLEGARVPIVGRVSMDLVVLDVSAAPANAARPGALVDLIGPDLTPDDVADAAGTISYEILTGLGARYHRRYVGGGGGGA